MNGKRGEKPPLPRNCERPLKSVKSHCPAWGDGKAQTLLKTSRVRRPVSPA